jgi:phosphatidylinositol alpha-mannosyltransferase
MTPDALRVAIVCPYDLSRPGGVQGQSVGLARALRRQGHEVVVVAPDDRPHGWATGHVYAAGRSVAVRSNGSVAPVSLSPLAARRAVDAVRDWRADVVHLQEPLAPALGYGFLLARRWPIAATFHRSGTPRAAPLASPLARWACDRIDARVAVSAVARATAASLCGGDYEVLFNGVDVERFARATPFRSDAPAVLFLGRHEHRKGLGVLLEAFASLPAGRVRAELWVAGEGPQTAALRARFPESARVHWLGIVSEEDAADRLCGASVLCAPSLGGESFGMVLLEAMAARCRVIASDIPGYRDAAAGHATLVPPGDVDALAAALAAALGATPDPVMLDAAAAHASAWSMDALARRYLDVYARALVHHGAPRPVRGADAGSPAGDGPGASGAEGQGTSGSLGGP